VLLSHAGDAATEVTWPQHDVDGESCWRQCCRVMLATALPRRLGRDVMSMPSHDGDGVVKATWPRYDVDAESCW
jgi:hypothetical protein